MDNQQEKLTQLLAKIILSSYLWLSLHYPFGYLQSLVVLYSRS